MIIQCFFSILNDYLMFSMTLDDYQGPGTRDKGPGTRDQSVSDRPRTIVGNQMSPKNCNVTLMFFFLIVVQEVYFGDR